MTAAFLTISADPPPGLVRQITFVPDGLDRLPIRAGLSFR